MLEDGEREFTEGFTWFMLHFVRRNSALFRSCLRRELHPLHSFFLSPWAEFCNPAAGNEKGNVENKVRYSRRNAFVLVPRVTSFESFNEWLWEWCDWMALSGFAA